MSLKLGNTNIAGTQILYSTTGNNTDGAMTQKATTDELNNCVHKTGNETISGEKTFNGIQKLNGNTLKCFNFARGTNPSSTQYVNYYMTDSTEVSGDNTAFGLFRTQVSIDGSVRTLMRVFKNNISGTNQYVDIGLLYPLTGEPSAYAPTPNVSSNGTNIATTAYVNNKFQVVSTLPASPDSNVFYFIPE